MTHRTFNLEYGDVHVFETGIAAHKFIRSTPGDLKVLCRKRFYFQRSANGELHVILRATRTEQTSKVLDAANAIANHIESEIQKAAEHGCDFEGTDGGPLPNG